MYPSSAKKRKTLAQLWWLTRDGPELGVNLPVVKAGSAKTASKASRIVTSSKTAPGVANVVWRVHAAGLEGMQGHLHEYLSAFPVPDVSCKTIVLIVQHLPNGCSRHVLKRQDLFFQPG